MNRERLTPLPASTEFVELQAEITRIIGRGLGIPAKLTTTCHKGNQMKIEAGKVYETRNGQRALIYATDGNGRFPIHGAIGSPGIVATWTPEGRLHGAGVWSDLDIIREYVEPRPKPKWRPFTEAELMRLAGRVVQREVAGKEHRFVVSHTGGVWVEFAYGLAVSAAELLEKFELVGADGETLYSCGMPE